jgi:ATP-binding cassette, subfamily B, heavy metal transporter
MQQFKKTISLFVSQINFKNSAIQKRFLMAILLIFANIIIASYLVPYYSKTIIESISVYNFYNVKNLILLFGIFWILEKSTNHIQNIVFFPIVNEAIKNITFKIVNHIHNISLIDYQQLSISEITNCIRRIGMSARIFLKIICLMIVPVIIKFIISLLTVIKTISLYGIILFPAILIVGFVLYKLTIWYAATREYAWKTTDKLIMRINDSMLNTKIVRNFKSFEMKDVGGLLDLEYLGWSETNTRLHIINIIIVALLGLILIAVLSAIIYFGQNINLTAGDFVLLKTQLIAAFIPFIIFADEYVQISGSLIDLNKIIKILEIPKEINQKNLQDNRDILKLFPGILCENISFSYSNQANNKYIFKNLSLHINAGEKIGIVGATGCGKSTLINLIAGLYQPTKGKVYINGPNIIHCIPQDFKLFNLSIRYNLTYGLYDISEKAINQVLNQVGIYDLIAKMPSKLDTVVGEMGIRLSAGEKQKIVLARALLVNPDILILDESTSSLNIEQEQSILNVIYSLVPTVIISSHRAYTLRNLDRILKIQNGLLLEVENKIFYDR